MELKSISTEALKQQVSELRGKEKELCVRLLLCLIEVEERKVFLEEGYSSMFRYLTEKLSYSEGGAHRRLTTARCLREFPGLKDYLVSGKVSLCSISKIASLLTKENAQRLLDQISGRSRREVEEIVSSYRPSAEAPKELVRAVTLKAPTRTELTSDLFTPVAVSNLTNVRHFHCESATKGSVTDVRFELRFSVGQETKKKLTQVQTLLSGKFPRGVSLEEVFSELVESYLEQATKPVRKTTRALSESHSRHIPAPVRREVMRRDGGCCTFVGSDGKRCGSNWDTELDHIVPFAAGGTNTADNLRVLCASHNKFVAEKYFGAEFIRACAEG